MVLRCSLRGLTNPSSSLPHLLRQSQQCGNQNACFVMDRDGGESSFLVVWPSIIHNFICKITRKVQALPTVLGLRTGQSRRVPPKEEREVGATRPFHNGNSKCGGGRKPSVFHQEPSGKAPLLPKSLSTKIRWYCLPDDIV